METKSKTPAIISQNIQVNAPTSIGITPPAVRPPTMAHIPPRMLKVKPAVCIDHPPSQFVD
jgi:hypothetical protein